MKINTSRGFTIIELLVVVAIIAVLAAIVLVNVTGYINQGKNAAVKGNMSTMLTNGAVYYDSSALGNGAYTNFCTHASYLNPEAAANAASGGTATEFCTATTWCSCSVLKTTTAEPSGSTYCVDSSGYKKVTTAGCVTRCTTGVGICAD